MTLCHPKMQPLTKFGIPSSNNIGEMLQTQLFYNSVRGQGHNDPKMVCDILPSQDASTHLIWNSYLKENRSFAPDLMPILETWSKVKVPVTGKWNMTIPHFKMHSHIELPSKVHLHNKFGIPTLKNVRDVLQTRILKTRSKVKGQCHSDSNMVRDTPPSEDAFPHQIWNSYLKEYRRYAPDSKQFLESRS